jgi:predicted metal-binding membrane protein
VTGAVGAGSAVAARGGRRVPAVIPAAIAAAWMFATITQFTGAARFLHHDSLIEGHELPLWAALLLFVLAWQAMTAAMMLPSSLPMIRLFAATSRNLDRPGRAQRAMIAGYALLWTAFGAVAFLGDVGVHHTVDATPWLQQHAWVIGAGTLALAGAFQFSSLKERCLQQCRHPGAFLIQHYRKRGTGPAFRLGLSHGLFCVGCCWALMLVMFAAGIGALWWMAALTALMYYEKVGRRGEAAAKLAGVGLLVLAVLVAVHPVWLPPIVGS